MTTNKRPIIWGIILFLVTACAPVIATQPASTPTVMSTLQATDQGTGNVLYLYVRYSFGQLSETTYFSVTHENPFSLTPTPNAFGQSHEKIPALVVVFKDQSGQVLLRQSLPVMFYEDYLITDGWLMIEWVAVVPDDPRYKCMVLESQDPLDKIGRIETKIEPPLHLCVTE